MMANLRLSAKVAGNRHAVYVQSMVAIKRYMSYTVIKHNVKAILLSLEYDYTDC